MGIMKEIARRFCGNAWRKAVLCLLLGCLLLAVSAYAEPVSSGTCGDNLIWTLDNTGTLTISRIS